MATSSLNYINVSSKKPKCLGPEYEYFEVICSYGNGDGYRVRCKFCNSCEMNSHATRMRRHLLQKCPGNVPPWVKAKLFNQQEQPLSPLPSNVRKRPLNDPTTSPESDQLTAESDGLGSSNNPHSAGESIPFSCQVNSHLNTEQSERMAKKLKLELQILEDQAKFWSVMASGAEKVMKAVDLYIESHNSQKSSRDCFLNK